ncbi:MAG: esterase [Lachnospiraceae bacterium]|nr:esterase [Lachnospiraceae bacterium]
MDESEIGQLEDFLAYLKERLMKDCSLVVFKVDDWNRELSPWDAPAVFGKDDFGHGAEETLFFVKNILIPYEKEKINAKENIRIILGGYSLAGLFSLYCGYQTDDFYAIAAASPSVWFQGWAEYIKDREFMAKRVYLSLGDKEDKSKNPLLRTVSDNIREQYDSLCSRLSKENCTLEWNEGNHFTDTTGRCVKGIIWCLR